MLNCYPTLCSA